VTTRALSDVVALAGSAQDPVVVSSAQGIEYVNEAFLRLTRYRADDLTGKPLTIIAHPAARAALEATVGQEHAVATPASGSLLLLGANGDPILTEHTCRSVGRGKSRYVVSRFSPVLDKTRLLTALTASQRRYRRLFDDDTCGRFVATPDWRLLDVNTVLARLLTGDADTTAFAGRTLVDFAPDRVALQKLMAMTRAEGRAGPIDLQLRNTHGDNVDVSCRLIGETDESGSLAWIHGQLLDVTADRRVQARLAGAERMEMVGRLAGGLAHDFNNLLTVISGNSDRLQTELPPDSPLRPAAAAIRQSAARASALTRQLLAFSRRQVFQLRPIALQKLVGGIQRLLTDILGEGVTLKISAPDGLPLVHADGRQIEDAIATLCINAREAMPKGGGVTISIDEAAIGEPLPNDRKWLRPGRYVRLVVADTGIGMDTATRAHAFEPFFTTKGIGEGRGLGLAMVYGIVKQSHGFVWIDSEPGKGAAVTLLFPVLEPETESAGVAPSADNPRAETILFVDEDPKLRGLAVQALKRRGYEVLEAASAAEALDVFASQPSRVHLLIADVRMTTEDGLPLADRLRGIDPLLQEMAMLAPADARAPRPLPTTPSIEKPFTIQALADSVKEVLSSGEGR